MSNLERFCPNQIFSMKTYIHYTQACVTQIDVYKVSILQYLSVYRGIQNLTLTRFKSVQPSSAINFMSTNLFSLQIMKT